MDAREHRARAEQLLADARHMQAAEEAARVGGA